MWVMARVRRIVARRPWIQWLAIGALALGVTVSVADATAGVEAERAAWGRPVTVWVATRDVAAGQPVDAAPREVPAAVRPPGALTAGARLDGALARQAIGRGEIVTELDVAVDARGIAPPDWLIAPLLESLPSGATVGERVQVASDGVVVATDAVVIDHVDGVTLVAVPPDVAPLLPVASGTTSVALLRAP